MSATAATLWDLKPWNEMKPWKGENDHLSGLHHFKGSIHPLILGEIIAITLPETNSEFTPENGWLEYDPFLLGFGLFSGAFGR